MATGNHTGVGATWQLDGRAVYRTDEHGKRIVLLPTHCPSGHHALAHVGYTATEHDQILRVSCTACRKLPRPDHAWALKTDGESAAAEFDDLPYSRLLSASTHHRQRLRR